MIPRRKFGEIAGSAQLSPYLLSDIAPASRPVRATDKPLPQTNTQSALPLDWILDPAKKRTLADRVLARLIQSEAHEACPHFRDDYRQTFIALSLVLKSSSDALRTPAGSTPLKQHEADQSYWTPHSLPMYFIEASYRMYGLHPDKVYPAILARRQAMLGPSGESAPQNPVAPALPGPISPKKAVQSVKEEAA